MYRFWSHQIHGRWFLPAESVGLYRAGQLLWLPACTVKVGDLMWRQSEAHLEVREVYPVTRIEVAQAGQCGPASVPRRPASSEPS